MLQLEISQQKPVKEDRFSGKNDRFHQRRDDYKYQKGGTN
jgi:hypothetical protein